MKNRIILVGDYNRKDFLFVAELLKNEIDFYFIEYLNEEKITSNECLKYGKVIFWKDFRSAYTLLDSIKPAKVIFYFIESFNQVALNVACKVKHIPTYHLEHGLRFSLSYYELGNKSTATPEHLSFQKKLRDLNDIFDKYKNRQFFVRTKNESPDNEKLFLSNYFDIRRNNSIFQTFRLLKNNLRVPDHYISFSPLIFNFHKELESLPDGYPVSYIGIPQFDSFIKWKNLINSGNHILFIDQPLHEQNIYGWTKESKVFFLKELVIVASSFGKQLYLKPHPFNDMSLYKEIMNNPFVVLFTDEWDQVVNKINTVLGFSSTLLLPFMAMEHINCFTFEMHPVIEKEPYSQFLINSGACHAVFNFFDLSSKINDWESWHKIQKNAKEKFIQNYMYKFDGKSSERLRSILVDEIS